MRSAVMRFGIVGLIVPIVGTYVALVEFYEDSVEGVAPNNLPDNAEVFAQTKATFTVEEMQSNYSAVVANLAVSPDLRCWIRSPTASRKTSSSESGPRPRQVAANTRRACFPGFFRSR